MTLPVAPNSISVSDINTEISSLATTSRTLEFLNGLILPAQRPATPNMNSFRGKAYYQRNTDGNCDNGNCGNCTGFDCACVTEDCGNLACFVCYAAGASNCGNCDTQSWLQTNCNCACSYQCEPGYWTYNCQCGG